MKKIDFLFFQAYNAIHLDLERYLRSHGINQVTIQPEFPGDISDDQMINSALKDCCYLNCHSDWCEARKCCDETQKAQINTTVIIWKKSDTTTSARIMQQVWSHIIIYHGGFLITLFFCQMLYEISILENKCLER